MIDFRVALQSVDIFADLPQTPLDQLAETAHLRTFKQNDQLFHQGEPATAFYVILSGRVRLIQHSLDGKDVTLATFIPNEVLGLIVAMMSDLYPGSAEALEGGETLVLPGDLMWQIMNEHAATAVKVVRMVAARLFEAQNRIRELSVERVQQRIARSILRLAQKVGIKESDGSIRLDLRLSRQDLAQMNGTTLETVSRCLTAWERDGIIDAGREQITLLKPHQLVVIAEDLPR